MLVNNYDKLDPVTVLHPCACQIKSFGSYWDLKAQRYPSNARHKFYLLVLLYIILHGLLYLKWSTSSIMMSTLEVKRKLSCLPTYFCQYNWRRLDVLKLYLRCTAAYIIPECLWRRYFKLLFKVKCWSYRNEDNGYGGWQQLPTVIAAADALQIVSHTLNSSVQTASCY